MEKEIKYRCFMITQQLKYLTEERIIEGLNKTDDSGTNHLLNYAYLLHNKDVLSDGTPKDSHWHICIRMDNAYTFQYIAERFGVEPQQVEKIKTTFSQALNYLTHNTEDAKKENKFLYDDDEVKSNYIWKKERQKAIDKEVKSNRKKEIMEQIENGTIRRYNYYNYISAYENVKYKREIDLTFKYREDKLRKGSRNMECIYIHGNSQCGKSTYAKKYAESMGLSYYVSGGSNDVLDGYEGQDCLILDELRPESFNLSDLLKILDNHTESKGKSRFHNISLYECKLIIITTVLTIEDFFDGLKSSKKNKEPIKQLKRRLGTKIFLTEEKVFISLYDEENSDYADAVGYENPIKQFYKPKSYKDEESYKEKTKLYLMTSEDLNNIKNNNDEE